MSNDLLCVGVVTTPFGIKGEVKVRVLTEYAENLFDFDCLLTEQEKPVKLTFVRSIDPQTVVVRIEGVKDRTQAEDWRQVKIYIHRSSLPEIQEEDAFYIDDLIGLKVKSTDGKLLGEVTAVFNFGASDIIEFFHEEEQKKVMVPLIPDAVPDINLSEGFVAIDPTFAM